MSFGVPTLNPPYRLKIIEILTNLLRSVVALSPSELLPCLLLCLNRPGAPSEGLELGIGETLLTRALAQATGRTQGLGCPMALTMA